MRHSPSPVRALISVLGRMPWWLCLSLSVVSFVALHALVHPYTLLASGRASVGTQLEHAVWFGVVRIGQYIVPVMFIAAAAVAWARRRKRQRLVQAVALSAAPAALDTMTWQEFEMLVAEAFRLEGFKVEEVGGGGADGGVDLVMTRDNERFLVQCKQWKALRVGVAVARELFGVMAARGAVGGYLVTSGSFTREAIGFSAGRNIYLVDGPKLVGMIRKAKTSQDARANSAQAVPLKPARMALANVEATPGCPKCGGPMVRRIARKGRAAGDSFWGCTEYPTCHGTRPA